MNNNESKQASRSTLGLKYVDIGRSFPPTHFTVFFIYTRAPSDSRKLHFPQFQRCRASLATGTRMALRARHVGEAQRRLGRTRDTARIAEAETHGRTDDSPPPAYRGAPRLWPQTRARSPVSPQIGHEPVDRPPSSPILTFFSRFCARALASSRLQRTM